MDLRHSEDINRLQKWLCRFVVEARKQDGELYPPTSLQNLFSGILRNLHGDTPDFLSKKDWRFRELRGTMEQTFSDLRKQGVGAEVKHMSIITKEEEDQLWKAKEMDTNAPKQLLQAVFFYVGKVFCLRGGVEKRGLKVSRFQQRYSPDHYVYIENGSKNNSGANLKIQNKVVPVYANAGSGERCVVALLDKYLSKLPPVAFQKDIFYMKPKTATPSDADSPWYEGVAVGKETLRTCWQRCVSELGWNANPTTH